MFDRRLDEAARAVEAHLAAATGTLGDSAVAEAMAYALRGGKRLRAFLVLESARLHHVAPERALWPAAAIEAMHAYSLVHDDLPCMDDDDLRRGQPTVHLRWDEATAVLAGDALQAMAFELVLNEGAGDAAVRAALAQGLARAAGAGGMVLGQALDIAAESSAEPLDLAAITALQAGKTGALFEWSAGAGPLMAGADPAPLHAYARALGLAFQITDDILDVTASEAETGKRVNKDAQAGKATFVSLLGLDAARARARDLADEAAAALDGHGSAAEVLQQAARFAISRAY